MGAEAADDRPPIDQAQFDEAIRGIGQFVDAFDFDGADDIISMLKDFHLSDDQSELYNRLKVLVKNLDRDRILAELSGGSEIQ